MSETIRHILNRSPEFVDSLTDDQIHNFGDMCWIEEEVILNDPDTAENYQLLPMELRLKVIRSCQDKRDDVLLHGDRKGWNIKAMLNGLETI